MLSGCLAKGRMKRRWRQFTNPSISSQLDIGCHHTIWRLWPGVVIHPQPTKAIFAARPPAGPFAGKGHWRQKLNNTAQPTRPRSTNTEQGRDCWPCLSRSDALTRELDIISCPVNKSAVGIHSMLAFSMKLHRRGYSKGWQQGNEICLLDSSADR